MSHPFRRYGLGARWYDVLSGEWPVYRAGRRAGVALADLRPGDTVVDLGCGTGLNFSLLHDAVGADGHIVGIDRSADMLAVAANRVRRKGWSNVRLVAADAARLDTASVTGLLEAETGHDRADTLVTTYALSVMGQDAAEAWQRAVSLLRTGATVCVVDMQPPTGPWRVLDPLARAACALGDADITARPWRLLEASAVPGSVRRRTVRGGHIVAVAGRIAAPGS